MFTVSTGSVDVDICTKISEVVKYFRTKESGSLLAFDWETTGLEHIATPLGVSFHQRGTHPIFVPTDTYFSKGIRLKDITDCMNDELPNFDLIAHNFKYDSMINVMNGVLDENINFVADTLGMIHMVDPTMKKKLEERVQADFGYAKPTFEEKIGKKWKNISWLKEGDELLPILGGYGGEDTFWTSKLYYKYKKLMDADAWYVLQNIEVPLTNVLRDMQIRGCRIDTGLLQEMADEIFPYKQKLEQQIYDECGCVFNLNSSPQKQEVFINQMGLPVIRKTKKGGDATDAKTMEYWAELGYPVGELMVKYSELQKLYTGYILAIPRMVDDENILRGSTNSYGTKTGRCSSSDPNLQNQPNNDDFPIRKAFVPRVGYDYFDLDYSQLELRIMAHISGDQEFTHIFKSGRDPHAEVARMLKTTRKNAKTCNFGVLYGLGIPSFAARFKVSDKEARKIIDDYHTVYWGFAEWKHDQETFAKRNGYVKNMFGRKLILHEASKPPYDRNGFLLGQDMRRAVNMPIQGTGADIVKLAMINIHRRFKEEKLDAHMLLQVHDELLVESYKPHTQRAYEIVIHEMTHAVAMNVPLTVDGKIGLDWAEMKHDEIPSLPLRFDYSLFSSIL